MPPLDEAVAAHLCPPPRLWSERINEPFLLSPAERPPPWLVEPIRLLAMAILQVFQAKLLRSLDESGIDSPAFHDLHSATDLALSATKAKSSGCWGRNVCSVPWAHCCCAHAKCCCYGEHNKKHTFSKRKQISSFTLISVWAPTQRSVIRRHSTPCHAG